MSWFDLIRREPLDTDSAPWPDERSGARGMTGSRDRRLARLTAQMAADGFAWPDRMPSGDAAADCLNTLDIWTAWRWPRLMRFDDLVPASFNRAPWPDGRQGAQFTAIADVGFAMADVAMALRPDLVWSVDAYDGHLVDGTPTSGHIVLVDPALPLDTEEPQVVDPFGSAMLRAMQLALNDRDPQPLREGLRGLLWFSHRRLFD